MSRDLTVRLTQDALDAPFKIWSDGRTELGEFAARAAETPLMHRRERFTILYAARNNH